VFGYYIGDVKIRDLIAGISRDVFLMLAGINVLFAHCNINGTLVKLTNFARKGFAATSRCSPSSVHRRFGLSSLGPGAITICALMAAPMHAVSLADENTGIFDAVMVANGTQAGNM